MIHSAQDVLDADPDEVGDDGPPPAEEDVASRIGTENRHLGNPCRGWAMRGPYVGGGLTRTFLPPVTPVALVSGSGSFGMNGVGVALDGITLDARAPVANIKAAFDIATLDDCGGHLNPHTGYHYHAATGYDRPIPDRRSRRRMRAQHRA